MTLLYQSSWLQHGSSLSIPLFPFFLSLCGSRNSLLHLNERLISKETTSSPTSCSFLYTQVFHSFHSSFLTLPFFFFSLSSHSPRLRLLAWRTGLSSWSTLWYSSELVWNINQLHSLFSGDFTVRSPCSISAALLGWRMSLKESFHPN